MPPEAPSDDVSTAATTATDPGGTPPGAEGWLDGGLPAVGLVGALVLALVVGWAVRGKAAPAEAPPALEDRALPVDGGLDASADAVPVPRVAPPPVGLAQRLRERMSRTRDALASRFDALFGGDAVDASMLEDLEDTLLVADVGVPTTERVVDAIRRRITAGDTDPQVLRAALRDEVRSVLRQVHAPFEVDAGQQPFVILVVGVNGSGKTTTIGKLAARFSREGRKVLVAAGDTYRAAAAEQLAVWAQRAGAELVRHDEGADPGAVVFDALDAAIARQVDVVLIDTAGRLQTQRPLMEQLGKVRRVIDKKVPGAPHATLLVVDGTMGQNALSQAQRFHDATPLTSVVVTKLDGTAKGGMVLALAAELRLPVAFVGIGEQVDDLRPFEVDAFVDALV